VGDFGIEELYFKEEVPRIRKFVEEFKSEMGNVGICMRLRYLYERIYEIEDEIIDRIKTKEDLKKRGRRNEILLVSRPLPELYKKLNRIEISIECLVNPKKYKENKITEEMIERAREYPITELMEFKKGFAFCPFHAERTPSFHYDRKHNIAFCFGCKKYADSIELYMYFNKTSFIETVKRLQ
jgi:hypothetical protein